MATVNSTDELLRNSESSTAGRFLEAAHAFNHIYTPLLCIFGTLGNCVSVTVFCRTATHRSLSSSFYLSALAISDTGFLISLGAVWLEEMGFSVINTALTCPLVMYLGQVTCFLSVWFIVAFTTERYFAVCHPLTRPTICTVARAKKVISILTIVALIGFSYVWVIASLVNFNLGSPPPQLQNWTTTTSAAGLDSQQQQQQTPAPSTLQPDILLRGFNSSFFNERIQNSTAPPPPSTWSPPLAPDRVGGPSGPTTEATSSRTLSEDSAFFEPPPFVTLCAVPSHYMQFSHIANNIDSVLTLILPFAIISYLNIRISMCVWRLKDQRDNMVAMAKMTSTNASNPSSGVPRVARANSTNNAVAFVYRSNSCSSNRGIRDDQQKQTPQHLLTPAGYSPNRQLLSPGEAYYNNSSPGSRKSFSCSSSNVAVDFEDGRTGSRCQYHTRTVSINGNGRNLNGSSSTAAATTNGVRRGTQGPASLHHTNAAEARVTKTLLLVSTVFLVLNLPSHAVRAAVFMQSLFNTEDSQGGMSEAPLAAQAWTNILFNMNFSVNFLLYCVSGKNFRMSVQSIFCRSLPWPFARARGHGMKIPKILKPRIQNSSSSCESPGRRRSNCSVDSRSHGDGYYPVSVTEVEESYA